LLISIYVPDIPATADFIVLTSSLDGV